MIAGFPTMGPILVDDVTVKRTGPKAKMVTRPRRSRDPSIVIKKKTRD
jgi:hypothetical protein